MVTDNKIVIRAENVGKVFCRDLRKSLGYGLMDSLGDMVPGGLRKRDEQGNLPLRKSEFWANQGVSFELRRGESLGLIGHNGAGKTTLLKMLNGLFKPDTGRIEMHGRVGALIALGAGFNPVLSGRENVWVNASVLGLSRREISEKFDEIVDFAELWDAIDSPVRNYSSGMQVRLGFAVASVLTPEILLLDEVLAVGDVPFRTKCFNRLADLKRKGVSFIVVTHQLQDLNRWVDRCLYLQQGKVVVDGDVETASESYLDDAPVVTPKVAGDETESGADSGAGLIRIESFKFCYDEGFEIDLSIRSEMPEPTNICLDGTLTDGSGELLKFSLNADYSGGPIRLAPTSVGALRVKFPPIFPQSVSWFLSFSVWSENHGALLHWRRQIPVPRKTFKGQFGVAGAAVTVAKLNVEK